MTAAAAPEEIHSSQPSDVAVRAECRRPNLPPQHAAMEADRPWHRPSSPPSSHSPLNSSGSGWIRTPAPRSYLPASLGSSASSTMSDCSRDPAPPLAGHFLLEETPPHRRLPI
ncbi:hypothetical protein VPH35_080641 [Triticum aestivum]|uniref:uncharacterized protein n=1 Tax=Triticum aestivum TaxID=4565 RepID=UPI001D02B3F2|nr:uncharacterized protein LOC123099225 [Triticum aestivum]XP_044377333.1 uncharacterized protein LOC123099226 [Triticum aestivum]